MGDIMKVVATDVQTEVVPTSGHWIMEENPDATVAMIVAFLDR